MKDYYQILDISFAASQKDIKEQYWFLVQAWHPDKFPNSNQKAKAEEKLKDINDAYEILGDPVRRSAYDIVYNEHLQRLESQSRQEDIFDIDQRIDALKDEVNNLNKGTPKIPSWWTFSMVVLIITGYAKSAISISMQEGNFISQAAIGVAMTLLGVFFAFARNRYYKTKCKSNLDLITKHNEEIRDLIRKREYILKKAQT